MNFVLFRVCGIVFDKTLNTILTHFFTFIIYKKTASKTSIFTISIKNHHVPNRSQPNNSVSRTDYFPFGLSNRVAYVSAIANYSRY